ncbi:hypothetical protein UPYG_G00277840 [Umbra pygmaea]|uniref:Uncharacterized protein n=1 Tax=Umbra pygmaea TaxID=75934 RepID=A0ABD0WKG8_UMBPY
MDVSVYRKSNYAQGSTTTIASAIPDLRTSRYGQRMGCAMCSQLADMWSVSARRSSRRAMELHALPEALRGSYHRVTGLHYMSSFSDAEDCCEDNHSHHSSTGSSCTINSTDNKD